MGLSTNSRCPKCNTKADVQLVDKNGLVDSIVKATSEEVVMEIACKEDNCNKVWRATFCFAGNQ